MFEQQERPEGFDADLVLGEPSRETIMLLLSVDPAALGRDDAVAAAAGAEMAKRLLDGFQLRCLAAAAGQRRQPGELSEVGQELSAATNLHHQTASCRTDLACAAVSRLPRTLAKLETGRYTLGHVDQIERATRELTDDQARRVDRQLPARPVLLKRKLADAIAAIDPDQLDRRAEQARTGRGVDFWTDALDGTAGLGVHGPLAQVAQIKAAVDSLAGPRRPGECRSLNQRRFDAVHDWARSVLGLPTSTTPSPRPGDGMDSGAPGSAGPDAGAGSAGADLAPGSVSAGCGACGR